MDNFKYYMVLCLVIFLCSFSGAFAGLMWLK